MSVLYWKKPERLVPTEEWKESYSADGAPPGTYVPNMSEEDANRWKAKITGMKSGYPQVEIHKSFSGVNALILVSLGQGMTKPGSSRHFRESFRRRTKGFNVAISLNGTAKLTFADMEELRWAVHEAQEKLTISEL